MYQNYSHTYSTYEVNQTPIAIEWVNADKPVEKNKSLKQGIWIYFFLLIFEGGLRKWILPGLATPLLIVRDPIALWLLLTALNKGLLPSNKYLTSMVFIGLTGIFTAFLFGHGNLAVALFGARILILHFPLMFVIGNIFERKDVENMGKVVVLLCIPMVLLIATQFYSPQSAFVNRGIGGDAKGGGFDGALGYFRPSGTFSFTNGNALFFGLAVCFVIYFWINPKNIKRMILIPATIGLVAAIPFSISRTIFFSYIITGLFAVFAMLSNPQLIGRLILITITIIIGLTILSGTKSFQKSTEAFTSRFENANRVEGGKSGVSGVIGSRVIGGLTGDLMESADIPFFGYGIGMGTNVGSMLLSGDKTFLISESEWGRLIGELGPLLGILVIFIRLALVIKLALLSFKKSNAGYLLPWILLSFGAITILQSQWAQPTSLGFSTLIGGLIIASLQNQNSEIADN